MSNEEAKKKIIFAADVDSVDEFRGYLDVFNGKIGAFKMGMEVVTSAFLSGVDLFGMVCEKSDLNVMLDLKFHDIPRTVKGAAKAVARHGRNRIFGFTIHCLGDVAAMAEAVSAVDDNFDGEEKPLVIGVTLLTSMEQSNLDGLGIREDPKDFVKRLAHKAAVAGVTAIVCSPLETKAVLNVNSDFIVINPGIRFKDSNLDDQKRVTTPGQAIENGASYVVMGSELRKDVNNINRAALEIEAALQKKKGV